MHVLIVGGSDAGISAALRIRELDQRVRTSVAVADDFPNWSICGLPYYIGGETPDWHDLAHRTEFDGIDVLRGQRVTHLDLAARIATITASGAACRPLEWDKLILATGSVPVKPELPGIDLPGVCLLHTMSDALALNALLRREKPTQTAVIVGAGYIGLEMAEALTHRGLSVTLFSRTDHVFPSVDRAFGQAIQDELERRGVRVGTGSSVASITAVDGGLRVTDMNGHADDGNIVLVAAGTRPDTGLAQAAGLTLGVRGAISVDRSMRTSANCVLAAGDCVETWHRVLERPAWLPLGTTAHKQGRLAGEVALGGSRMFAGSVGTQVVKIFDIVAARTGLLDAEARAAKFDPVTVEIRTLTHKSYYPGAEELRLRITGDRGSGRLLGAQILGPWRAEIAKRIDVFAAALFHGMKVVELNDLDLSYAPPFSSPWDPIQVAAQAWSAEVLGSG